MYINIKEKMKEKQIQTLNNYMKCFKRLNGNKNEIQINIYFQILTEHIRK